MTATIQLVDHLLQLSFEAAAYAATALNVGNLAKHGYYRGQCLAYWQAARMAANDCGYKNHEIDSACGKEPPKV